MALLGRMDALHDREGPDGQCKTFFFPGVVCSELCLPGSSRSYITSSTAPCATAIRLPDVLNPGGLIISYYFCLGKSFAMVAAALSTATGYGVVIGLGFAFA
jgi:hypothetical protein